jgi:hypothetical protein
MICHLSIPAKEPVRVGRVIAKVIDGDLMNYPIVKGAVMVMARDSSGMGIEVWPETTTQHPGKGEADPNVKFHTVDDQPWDYKLNHNDSAPGAYSVHVAVNTKLTVDELLELGRKEGWRCLLTDRAVFKLVELWLENHFLLEVIPEGEFEKYRNFSKPGAALAFFGPVQG